ncbi:MAG TPA: aminomethyl-transferring glycine dehydrogenase subunit GcvPA [Planctomycetota bacterium]|nr:aminomethyl-transferring glycine dehydrogenase subunit GcvPA [Planctomycetota bacterium]
MPYIPHTDTDIREMLAVANVANLDDLFSSIPKELRLTKPLALPAPLSEMEATKLLSELADQNTNVARTASFLGAGCYNHFVPAVVDHLAARSEFYTAYTPYQPETSQGALTTAFEYQTMMCQLTGMEVSNASLYDGATALAEAILMALHTTNKKKVIISKTIHPEYRATVKAWLDDLDINIIELDFTDGVTSLEALGKKLNDNTACVAYQSPNFFGIIEPVDEIVKLVRKQENTMVISVVNPMSLGLLKPPGEYGVDIVVGDAQPLGNRMSFGGPHLGFMATKMAHIRKMPGRIVGETTDAKGRRGFVLTLSTREQHIRREKATSNICSNQALCAIRTAIYLSAVGKTGLQQVANLNLQKAHYAADQISKIPGFKLAFGGAYFNEFVIECPKNPEQINKKLLKNNIIGGLALKRFYPKLKNSMLLCVTEMTTRQEIDNLVNILSKV